MNRRRDVALVVLGVAGLVCISWQSLSAPQHGSLQGSLFGLLCAETV